MKTLAFIFILTTLFATIPCSAQTGIAAQAIIDARKDAKKDVNIIQWTALGCCFTIPTYAALMITKSEVPINRFMGKSPEYISFYTQEYQRKTKSLQHMYAVIGWGTGLVVTALYYYTQDERPPFLW